MEIREVEIGLLKPYENNPRNNEAAVDKVAASISEFGFKVPIIIDRENVIVAAFPSSVSRFPSSSTGKT